MKLETWILNELRHTTTQQREFDKGYFHALKKVKERLEDENEK